MYSLLVGMVCGIAAGLLVYIRYSLAAMIVTAVFITILVTFLLGRKLIARLQEAMQASVKQLEGRKFDQAIAILDKSAWIGKWLFYAKSQLDAQRGYILYLQQEFDKALPYLKNAFIKHWVAQGMLASIYHRRKDPTKMQAVLEKAAKSTPKESVLWGLYGYLLVENGKKDEALKVLARGAQENPSDEALKANVLQLQNGKGLKMEKFGPYWYQFLLEKPPQRLMMQPPPRFSAFKRRPKQR